MKTTFPKDYVSTLSLYETQSAVELLKRVFEENIKNSLNLKRVSAPLFVESNSGLNDDLNGYERPVAFDILNSDIVGEVVHSLAKWKRLALYKYGFKLGKGLYTDMNAIRRDEELDNIHSIYVDQWDWEKVIDSSQRNFEYLKSVVSSITLSIVGTLNSLKGKFPNLKCNISPNIFFITSEELLLMYPNLNPKEREHEITKKHKTVFIMQIGDVLSNGEKHDGRAPDYDDWALNGDLLFWHEPLGIALEISSMGIRVDSTSLKSQLEKSNAENRKDFTFHKMLLNGQLPLTIGGGIGQSRLSMLLLDKVHIGEVQSSIWDKETTNLASENKINLL